MEISPSPAVDGFAQLCRSLVDASTLPRREAGRASLSEALQATGMDAAVMVDGRPEGRQRIGAVATRSGVSHAVPGLPCEGHDVPDSDWLLDVDAVTVARRGLRADSADRGHLAGELILLSFTEHDLTETDQLVIDVVARFAALTCTSRTFPLAKGDRLRAHVTSALRTRDQTGNGISVARGWLDQLAHGEVDEETRDRGLGAAHRRLADVQAAIDSFIQTTTHALMSDTSSGSADLVRVWRAAMTIPLAISPTREVPQDSLEIVAHETGLDAFLRAAGHLLVPEATVLPGRVRIPLTDAGGLDDEARALLGASLGGIALGRDGDGVDWRLAREHDASISRLSSGGSLQT